jgi:hypothetical protein
MKIRIVWVMPVLIAGLIIYGCSPESKYERRLKHELASGVRYDTLFMGIYLGMPEKDFYTHCWMLNREGLIRQGSKNKTVEHELREELKYPATMNFYPEFAQGKIIEMPVRFTYNGWAPWNKSTSSDSLAFDVLRWYEKIYGDGFIKVEHPKRGMAYVRIDGNRRITIFKEDDMHVWAVFKDMLAERVIQDEITKDPEE